MTDDQSATKHVRSLLPAYALGALDSEDRARVVEHLRSCQVCLEALSEYDGVQEGLLHAAPAVAPPEATRRRVLASVGEPIEHGRPHGMPVIPWLRLAGVVAALALVVTNLFLLVQNRELRLQGQQLMGELEADRSALALLANPDYRAAEVSGGGGRGTLVYAPGSRLAVLTVWDLQPIPEHREYQAWLIDEGGNRVSGGLFRPLQDRGQASLVIRAPAPLRAYVALGVTVEPAGGSPGPTGEKAFGTEF
jgi:anti-sigma-K factor RskA